MQDTVESPKQKGMLKDQQPKPHGERLNRMVMCRELHPSNGYQNLKIGDFIDVLAFT